MGVIFQAGDDVAELLIPFARRRGCTLDDSAITNVYRRCSLGQFSSAALWNELGLAGEVADLDPAYLSLHRVTAGLGAFLATMRAEGIPVGCLSNDVAEWSRQLRRMHGLEVRLILCIISGEVGARKPALAIYQCFIEAARVRPDECLFVDDRAANLDAACELGFHVVQFAQDSGTRSDAKYPCVSSFDELSAWLKGSPH
jgi:putative hydrolase of the HAD superfamily